MAFTTVHTVHICGHSLVEVVHEIDEQSTAFVFIDSVCGLVDECKRTSGEYWIEQATAEPVTEYDTEHMRHLYFTALTDTKQALAKLDSIKSVCLDDVEATAGTNVANLVLATTEHRNAAVDAFLDTTSINKLCSIIEGFHHRPDRLPFLRYCSSQADRNLTALKTRVSVLSKLVTDLENQANLQAARVLTQPYEKELLAAIAAKPLYVRRREKKALKKVGASKKSKPVRANASY
ncbi:hypothetical protein BAUCODRAFT_217383 [Baudoinia panamericana UAMH 10762]|uniref:Uncharacterized protein n=1 Tax=Baudoinia panamericana (strain UAMH 10762) TaxID=717646 RepID=M2LIK9_BAUPA|nr:uncharacterized protein BAUCODRAFT_217383 [Baudoinia panamericana UAMH 10762]EMC93992.1 hypothetical protein BAUCODRAFT_217383 [Baudoinia panamericana UAMH 10762]